MYGQKFVGLRDKNREKEGSSSKLRTAEELREHNMQLLSTPLFKYYNNLKNKIEKISDPLVRTKFRELSRKILINYLTENNCDEHALNLIPKNLQRIQILLENRL